MARAGVLGFVVALSLVACGGGDSGNGTAAEDTTTRETVEPLTVELMEVNDSGYTGTATFTPNDERTIATFQATVTVTPPSENPQLAAIHSVTCSEYDPQIPAGASLQEIFDAVSATAVTELGEVRRGKAMKTAAGSLAERTTGEYSIIVHDNAPPYQSVACGDIPER